MINNKATLILLDNAISVSDFESEIILQTMGVNKLKKEGLLKIYHIQEGI